MTSPHDLLEHVLNRLSALPSVTLYVGHVPDTVPVIPGTVPAQIKPYVVVWPGETRDPRDIDLAQEGPGYAWTAYITVAARNAGEVMSVAHLVRSKIHRSNGPGGSRFTHIDTGSVVRMDPDPSVKPSRAFLAMEFGVQSAY